MRTAAELRLHADDQIEQLLSLDDLRRGLSTNGGSDHSFDIRNVYSVAGDLSAIDVDKETRLSELANHGEIGESGDASESVLDLDGLVLKDVQVVAVDFDGERTFQAGEGLVDRIFGRLRVVENDPGEGRELFVDRVDQFFFIAEISVPNVVFVRLKPDVELAVEEAGGIGAVVGAAKFRADDRDLRIRHQNVADLRGNLTGFFERNCVGHRRANPESAFIEVRHELSADERNQ